MAILSGPEIEKQVAAGRIRIDPYNPKLVRENSYDVHLGATLRVYAHFPLDPRTINATTEIVIPPEGWILQPWQGYLGSIIEQAGSDYYVPYIDGVSSIGRLFLSIHQTAGRGEAGFCSDPNRRDAWTVEMVAVHPIIIYPGMRIGQVTFHTIEGAVRLYQGRYRGAEGPVASRAHLGESNP